MYSENLDVVSNSDFVTLSPKPKLHVTLTDNPEAMYFLERGIDKPVFGDDNTKIFFDNVFKYDANSDVRMFWSNSKYLYWFDYSEDIYRILLTDVNGSWAGKVETRQQNRENDTGKGFVVE